MFTIGRKREKQHVRKFLGNSLDPAKIEAVIDAVHDLLEGGAVSDSTRAAFRNGFVDARSGTWETTGSWLAKTVREFPSLASLWVEFAGHRSPKVRFRAAAFLDIMPENCATTLLPQLLADQSAKVRSKVAGE